MKVFGEKKSGQITGFVLVLFAFFSFLSTASAQMKDTAMDAHKRYPYVNIPKIEISSWLLYPSSFHVAYERVLTTHTSFELFGGYNALPSYANLNITGTSLSLDKTKGGYSFGAEFRFYLLKENKYIAPHGVYLAPYFSYYNFNSNRTLTHTDSTGDMQSVNLNSKVTFLSFGGELGYQFVLGKRIVIDCEVFGPSFTYYTFQASLNGELDGLSQNEILQQVIASLKNKLPFLNSFSNGETVSKSGFTDARFPAIGFRYALNIGFAF
jgi:hypothetical protein